MGSDAGAYDYCLSNLRDTDRDRYLACLLSPENKRGALAALYAFNAELARIRDTVRDPLPGEIRMQWWRDFLDGQAAGDGSSNPLAQGLRACIQDHSLPTGVLHDMIDARIFDLYDDPMDSRSSLEGYAGETASALIQLASLILDPGNAAQSSAAAGHAGVAQSIAGALLLLPIHQQRGQMYIPAEILAATGLDRDAFLKGSQTDAMTAAIRAFAGLGRDHLARARQGATISKQNFCAFLPIALVEPVFEQAEKLGFRAASQPVLQPQWRRQWRMWRAKRKQRF